MTGGAGAARSVVICHVYNEELLLPYWLAHHRRLFDHGVILDYASTDGTRAAFERAGLDWEFRPSRNEWFDAEAVDAEVMDVEAEFAEGVWKMALTATEHLFVSSLDRITTRCPPEALAVAIDVTAMIDPPSHRSLPVSPRIPLYLQRHHGAIRPNEHGHRFLHRARRGEYHVGRHRTNLLWKSMDGLVLKWIYSPFDAIKARKLQIGPRIPEEAGRKRLGLHHMVDEEGLEQLYLENQDGVHDLLGEPRFVQPLLDICRDWPDWRLR